MEFILSTHVRQRAHERGIELEMIEEVMRNPDKITDDDSGEIGQKVYQSLFTFSNEKPYLVRVFISTVVEPHVVKSVYRTSKLDKYNES